MPTPKSLDALRRYIRAQVGGPDDLTRLPEHERAHLSFDSAVRQNVEHVIAQGEFDDEKRYQLYAILDHYTEGVELDPAALRGMTADDPLVSVMLDGIRKGLIDVSTLEQYGLGELADLARLAGPPEVA